MRSVLAILYDNDNIEENDVVAQHKVVKPTREQWARWRSMREDVQTASLRTKTY